MSRLPISLQYAAMIRAGTMHDSHAIADYTVGVKRVRWGVRMLEALDTPGVVWGWIIVDRIEDRFAPMLPAAFAALWPGGDVAVGAGRNSLVLREEAGGAVVAGYIVTAIRQGTWTEINDLDAWLGSLGLRFIEDPQTEDQAVLQAYDALRAGALASEPATALGDAELRARVQPGLDLALAFEGLTRDELIERHGHLVGLGRYLEGLT